MKANYFFIDGSALTAQIRQLRRAHPDFRGKKLCPLKLASYLMNALPELHGHEYKRITFYFPKGDETAVEEYLLIPDPRTPGQIRDLNFKFCGEKLKKSVEFEKIVDEHIPPKFQGRFTKSEKGIDIEICCDALRLASASRIERLFLFTNDSDFIPFCRTLKEFGVNISILHLYDTGSPNIDLLRESDSYDVVPLESLVTIFFPIVDAAQPPEGTGDSGLDSDLGTEDAIISEKPEASPADLPLAEEPEHRAQGPAAQTGGASE